MRRQYERGQKAVSRDRCSSQAIGGYFKTPVLIPTSWIISRASVYDRVYGNPPTQNPHPGEGHAAFATRAWCGAGPGSPRDNEDGVKPKTVILLAGLAALAFPAWLLGTWAIAFQGNPDHESRVAQFMSFFPQTLLPNPSAATLLALGCSVAGLLSGIFCVRGTRGVLRVAAIFAIFLGAGLASPMLFSLM